MCTDDRRVVLGLHRSRHRRDTLEAALELGVRNLDTAYNYLRFTSHAAMAGVAGDLLGEFTISTKAGFFRSGHSLDPFRLRCAVEQSANDLGRAPDLVLLHNPERSLDGLPPDVGRNVLAAATAVLLEAAAEGLAKGWGISSWRAASLAPYAAGIPTPDVLMTRCGFTVGGGGLEAAERLAGLLDVPPGSRWGMSPFGGGTGTVPWPAAHIFVPGQPCSPVQAAFVAAFHLPETAAVAVGADRPQHLAELVATAQFDIDSGRVAEYRNLLNERMATVTT